MHPLVGTWALEQWTSGSREPFGPRPQGTLVYTAEGTMIACFMRAHRAPVAASLDALTAWRRAPERGDVERRFLEAALYFNAYSGRYSVEGARVHHDVEVALYPEWIGQRLSRDYRVDSGRLTLSFGSDALVWRALAR